jgi:hypothetical protein
MASGLLEALGKDLFQTETRVSDSGGKHPRDDAPRRSGTRGSHLWVPPSHLERARLADPDRADPCGRCVVERHSTCPPGFVFGSCGSSKARRTSRVTLDNASAARIRAVRVGETSLASRLRFG